MVVILEKALELYRYLNDDLADPRVTDYPMLSITHMVGFIAVYNIFVRYVLPWWMTDKSAFNIRNLIVVYDVLQIIVNLYMAIRVMILTYFTGNYNLFCEGVEKGTSPEEIMLMNCAYLYYLVKLLDLLDTVFLVLSKKAANISFLHVYHHSAMIFAGWAGIKYAPGGQSVSFGALNSFVHMFMYTYYLLTALKYLDSRHIVWKRSLTQLQMVQFGINIIHQACSLLSDCKYPKFISFLLVTQNMFMLILFGDFYRKAYKVKRK